MLDNDKPAIFPIDLPGREGNSSRVAANNETTRKTKCKLLSFSTWPRLTRDLSAGYAEHRWICNFSHTIHASIPSTINQPSSTGLHRVIQCRRAISNVIQKGCHASIRARLEKGKGDLDVSSCVEYFSRGVGNSLEACIVFSLFLSFSFFFFNLNFWTDLIKCLIKCLI